MTIKKRLSGLITAAMAMALSAGAANAGANAGAGAVNAFGNTKALKAPRKPKIPKTPADYEAMHAAEMKRRRKAKKRAQQPKLDI